MMVMPRKRRKPVAEINVVPYIDDVGGTYHLYGYRTTDHPRG